MRLYVVLEVNGEYFFYPDWGREINYAEFIFPSKSYGEFQLFALELPEEVWEIKDIKLYTCLYDPENNLYHGVPSEWTFSILGE